MSKKYFNPAGQRNNSPTPNVGIHFSNSEEKREVEDRARAANMTTSYFCLEAVRYAIANMKKEDE